MHGTWHGLIVDYVVCRHTRAIAAFFSSLTLPTRPFIPVKHVMVIMHIVIAMVPVGVRDGAPVVIWSSEWPVNDVVMVPVDASELFLS